eukprot:m.215158 g.215158  ORF g.215158 m.215158 type:complete len:443 (+) comp27639_c0_seq1:80-1408(+)
MASSEFPPRLDFREEGSFPWTTLTKRMPTILNQAIEQAKAHTAHLPSSTALTHLHQLRDEMATDGPLTPIEDTGADCKAWNDYLATAAETAGATTWMSAPWLLAECYMYRRIVAALRTTEATASLDPFRASKEGSFTHALTAIRELATIADVGFPGNDRAQFGAWMHMSLWGNKMDLSLHANAMSTKEGGEALRKMQSRSQAQLDELQPHVLCDDTDTVWTTVTQRCKGARIDIVLDNAGYELFTDLCLAHWLSAGNHVGTVVFHTKELPWFVSDASNTDVEWLVNQLATCGAGASDSDAASVNVHDVHVARLGRTFRAYFDTGRWQLKSHSFWTLPHEFSLIGDMAPTLKQDLNDSALVLLKGDLNYRKLLADRSWDPTTPLVDIARAFSDTSFCALRTLKANLVCGLAPGVAEQTAAVEPAWQVKGVYGVIQAVPPVSEK